MTLQPTIYNLPARFQISRKGHPIVAIVAHGTAGTDSRAYLQSGGGRGVSIHVLIQRDGDMYRMVADERGANHAGYARLVIGSAIYSKTTVNVNRVTLGFELESRQRGTPDDYTESMLLSMGFVVNQWRATYGAIPIVRHGDIDPTRRSDPVKLSVVEMEQWAQRAALHFSATRLWRIDPRVTAGAVIRTKPDLNAPRVGLLYPNDAPFRGDVVQGGLVSLRVFGQSREWVRMGAGCISRLLVQEVAE